MAVDRPVIALLTDFGLADHYVGSMKGIIAGICREAVIVDLTHGVPPQDIMTAAFELLAGYRAFPHGTVFIVVVDPGVGTSRRAIAARAGEYVFVGPDNGVFDLVFDELPPSLVVELTNARYALAIISRTFEGRDRFAPAGAWLASGVPQTDLGPAIGVQPRLNFPRPTMTAGAADGEVVHVDRFGNLVTNIERRMWPGEVIDRLDVAVSGYRTVRLVSTYAEAAPGEVVALFGGTDRLEIAVRSGNATEALGVGRGTTVHVSSRA
jgi:S-adenosylmethionine hydrolase